MKATLKFDMDEPSDQVAHERCARALDLVMAFTDVINLLRSKIKYPPESQSEETTEVLIDIRSDIFEILESRNINLDSLHQ